MRKHAEPLLLAQVADMTGAMTGGFQWSSQHSRIGVGMAEQKHGLEQKQAVLAAVDRGSTVRAASIAVGVAPDTEYRWVKRAGLSTSRSSSRK